jgi:NAD(P)-dependent dehydrogenase (short-subunit alcohol dehydrogenase family)
VAIVTGGDSGIGRAVAALSAREGDRPAQGRVVQHPDKDVADISDDQLRRTFQTNILGIFFMVQAARPHPTEGAAAVNCTSVTNCLGEAAPIDYSSLESVLIRLNRSYRVGFEPAENPYRDSREWSLDTQSRQARQLLGANGST